MGRCLYDVEHRIVQVGRNDDIYTSINAAKARTIPTIEVEIPPT